MAWEKIGLATAGAVVALGLTAAGMTQLPPGRRVAPSPPPAVVVRRSETTTKIPEVDPRWVKSLPNGATIEVVGVSTHPSGPRTWWRPDGKPLDQPPCDPSGTKLASDEPDIFRAIAVRISGIPAGAHHNWWAEHARGGSQGQANRAGKPVDGLSEAIAPFSKGTKSCTIRFEVASGPWKTVQKWGTSSGGTSSRTGASFIFSDPIATGTGTALSITHDLEDRSIQIVAVDRKDKEHISEFRSGTGVKDFQQLVVEFDLPPEQIKEFRVQAREYEKIEIPNVSLEPAGPA